MGKRGNTSLGLMRSSHTPAVTTKETTERSHACVGAKVAVGTGAAAGVAVFVAVEFCAGQEEEFGAEVGRDVE